VSWGLRLDANKVPPSARRAASYAGGNALKAYRVYSFDGVNRIIAAENIEAETDAQALRAAKEVASGISFEVWDQHRLVARYKP
jgi:hypothetical protein